jgi:uncharacterized protein YjbI with pentapeptide repeats
MPEIDRRAAPVRPKAVSPASGETLLLEDLIEPYLRRGEPGALCVYGPPRAGKSLALAHLAAALPRGSIVAVLDDAKAEDVRELADRMLVIYSAPAPHPLDHRAKFPLAPWGEDDCLEYLLAVHRDRCASVLARVKQAPDPRPQPAELLAACLDEMAASESVRDFRTAIARTLDRTLSGRLRRRARPVCLDAVLGKGLRLDALREPPGCLGILLGRAVSEISSLLGYEEVQLLLAAEAVVEDLRRGREGRCLSRRLTARFIREIGLRAAAEPKALSRLRALAEAPTAQQAMAASVLHASNTGWKPRPARPTFFQRGYFARADWPGLKLPFAILIKADLSGANLSAAQLESAVLEGARLPGAALDGSRLGHANLDETVLSGAALSHVWAESARFRRADLSGANLEYAVLRDADLEGANLSGACFRQADLRGAVLRAASIEGADFTGADLERAKLPGVDLTSADFSGCRFRRAHLCGARLEGAAFPGAVFDGADLQGALLTGAAMPRASLRRARLRSAGLAHVDWEGADLRGANLSWATFHLGTSRSGLVFGEPLEGSRTGFYNDDPLDALYRPPEEIRQANLRGADLRGACLTGVDFYRVDLREARYDPAQERLFRRYGAILGGPR